MNGNSYRKRRESGIVMPLTAVAMLSLLAMAGLALDMGHLYVNKTRLQNAVDAAALSAAKTLDLAGNDATAEDNATAAAQAAFDRTIEGEGNSGLEGLELSMSYSTTVNPFSPGGSPVYARAEVAAFTTPSIFAQVVGIDSKTARASAVAGPSPVLGTVCNALPIVLCGTAGAEDLGYPVTGQPMLLRTGPVNGNWEIGPGNFRSIQLNCGPGANCIRENMAGAFNQCLSTGAGSNVTTQPGQTVGPVGQGINTRFGCPNCGGPGGGYANCGGLSQTQYPPDKVTDAGAGGYGDTFAQYGDDYEAGNFDHADDGREQRRVVPILVGTCNASTTGQGQVPIIGTRCFFLTRPVVSGGGNGNNANCATGANLTNAMLCGEVVQDCEAVGTVGPDPSNSNGPLTIILYNDTTAGVSDT